MAEVDEFGVIVEEPTEGGIAPVEEEVIPAEEETAVEPTAGTPMQHTVEEIPELADKNVGDTITFEIKGVSDDGIYDLAVLAEEAPVVEEEVGVGGREAVTAALAG